MAELDIHARIEAEITKAMEALGAPPATLRLAGTRNSEGVLSAALERLGAPIELMAIIGSYGDTLTDAEVLEAIQAYNRGEATIEVDLDAREL